MNKAEVIERIKQARELLDPIYYWSENSTDCYMSEINRLMCWADSTLMDAEAETNNYFDKD